LDVRIRGLVGNMSYFTRVHSIERIELFGAGGGETLSRDTSLPLLAAIPIDIELRKGGDVGVPVVVGHQESETSRVFREMARKIMAFP
jgi:ATP-binding protein involved in chromosome partitioning